MPPVRNPPLPPEPPEEGGGDADATEEGSLEGGAGGADFESSDGGGFFGNVPSGTMPSLFRTPSGAFVPPAFEVASTWAGGWLMTTPLFVSTVVTSFCVEGGGVCCEDGVGEVAGDSFAPVPTDVGVAALPPFGVVSPRVANAKRETGACCSALAGCP
jgi:hypothetical protein